MGKLIIGFVFGFLACVWTYGLDPTEAVFGFSNKIAIVHDEVQEEYQVDSRHGHKGQHSRYNQQAADLASPIAYWLTQMGGPPVM